MAKQVRTAENETSGILPIFVIARKKGRPLQKQIEAVLPLSGWPAFASHDTQKSPARLLR